MDLITLDSTQLKKLHQNELSLLKEVDRLCTKHHIKYTLYTSIWNITWCSKRARIYSLG